MSWRLTNLRFKAPRSVIKQRLLVFWSNVLRIRFLHQFTEPGGELVFEGFDQKPLWFTASSQERGLALRGARKVATKENVPATRSRFTAMTRCRWPTPPSDGKYLAILFKASGSGVRIRETIRVPPSVLLQFQEKGSYRLADVLAYLSWILDRSRMRPPAANSQDAANGQGGGPGSEQGGVCEDGARPHEEAVLMEGVRPDGESVLEDGVRHDEEGVVEDGVRPDEEDALEDDAPPMEDPAQAATSQASGAAEFGRRVVYLLDWFAPHLDASLDAMVHEAGHAILRIGGHLTGLVQVNDTHAHGPMTAVYKKRESLEAFEQLSIRPDRLPSTTRQTVLGRACDSWSAISQESCARGYVSNGIANKLDGSEDAFLSLDVQEFWEELDMCRRREEIGAEVLSAIRQGKVTGFADYQSLLEPYPAHPPVEEGQEAFQPEIVPDGDHDGTDDEGVDDNMDDGDDGDDGAPPLPPPLADPSPPPSDAPRDGNLEHSDDQGGDREGGRDGACGGHGDPGGGPVPGAAAISHGGGQAAPSHNEFIEAAGQDVHTRLGKQRQTIDAALQAVLRGGGDRALADSLRGRLRVVDKRLHAAQMPVALRLRAKAMERKAASARASLESIAEDARAKALKLEVELTKAQAELAKARGREAAAAANAASAEAKEKRAQALRLKAKADEEIERLATQFASVLAARLEEYLPSGPIGEERRSRCRRIALKAAGAKAGRQPFPTPRFWTPTVANMRRLTARGVGTRLRAKGEVLYASADFCWSLTKRRSNGAFECGNEPKFLFRQLIERTMPGYFHVLGGRYGVDNMLAESRHVLDLAFVAAAWRYTHVVGGLKYFRYGLAEWPCLEDWWASGVAVAPCVGRLPATAASASTAPAGTSGAAAATGADATSHVGGAAEPVAKYTSV